MTTPMQDPTTSAAVPATSPGPADPDATWSRPTTRLTGAQLFQISAFWFALNAIWGAFEIFQQERLLQLVGKQAELAIGPMEILALPIAALTMPVMGSISDYTTTRYGRRKPYILVGSALTALTIVGLALSPTFPILVLFFIALQFASNAARGPFAGLVPDLVPEPQVGIASGLMGLMITLGLVGGYLLLMIGYLLKGNFAPPMIALAVFVVLAGVASFLWIPTGPPGKPRQGRSWSRIGLETFGTDILRERDYVFLLGSRFCILMATGFFMNLNILYLKRTFGLDDPTERGTWVLISLGIATLATAIGTLPGARISDRVGRKPVIYASTVIGSIGMAIVALAPTLPVVVVGVGAIGLAAGAFLSVDWALMTDIIPKASAGRYMGMSNIVEASNGPIASSVGGVIMYAVGLVAGQAIGGRTAMLTALVLFALGAALLTRVHEPRRTAASAPGTPSPRPAAT